MSKHMKESIPQNQTEIPPRLIFLQQLPTSADKYQIIRQQSDLHIIIPLTDSNYFSCCDLYQGTKYFCVILWRMKLLWTSYIIYKKKQHFLELFNSTAFLTCFCLNTCIDIKVTKVVTIIDGLDMNSKCEL